MALTNCKECGKEISKNAKECPHCGEPLKKKPKHYGCGTLILLGIIGIILISIFSLNSAQDRKKKIAAEKEAQRQAEQHRLAAMTPEEKAENEKKRQEQERARQEAEKQRLGIKWNYQENDDKMGRGKIKTAFVHSINQVEFDFPYKGAQRATLQLRNHPAHGKDVIFTIERGQFTCGINECIVQVKFGHGKALKFNASKPADHSSTVLFINNYDKFVNSTKKVDRVFIEAQFYKEGAQVFEFDVSGLNWP